LATNKLETSTRLGVTASVPHHAAMFWARETNPCRQKRTHARTRAHTHTHTHTHKKGQTIILSSAQRTSQHWTENNL